MHKAVARRVSALILIVSIVALVSWGLYKAHEEDRIEFDLTIHGPFVPKSYHLSLDSIDEVSGRVRVRAQVVLDRTMLLLTKETRELLTAGETQDLAPRLQMDRIKVFFGPLEVQDLSDSYRVIGLWYVQSDIFHSKQPGPNFTQDGPKPIEKELTALGNPTLYPFDQYVVMGRVSCDALATKDKKRYVVVPGETYDLDFRIPGFTLRNANGVELQEWDDATKRLVESLTQTKSEKGINAEEQLNLLNLLRQGYRPELWHNNRFAFVLGRRFFLKFFACFLAVPAFLSLIYVGYSENPKHIILNAVGYFLGLWAIHQALSADAPKTATLIDYATVIFYALLVVVVLAKLLVGFKERDIAP